MEIGTETYEVGDMIKFKLTGGENVEAMAVKGTPRGILFTSVDCLAKEYPMFNDIGSMDEDEISYMTSDLRKKLNGEILARFPEEIRNHMVAVNAEGDMLRIPTEWEIFGENVYGQEENEWVERWEPMKRKRNRIAFQGKEGAWERYWLMNRHKDYASHFVTVINNGNADYDYAYNSIGVRPVFLLDFC